MLTKFTRINKHHVTDLCFIIGYDIIIWWKFFQHLDLELLEHAF